MSTVYYLVKSEVELAEIMVLVLVVERGELKTLLELLAGHEDRDVAQSRERPLERGAVRELLQLAIGEEAGPKTPCQILE